MVSSNISRDQKSFLVAQKRPTARLKKLTNPDSSLDIVFGGVTFWPL